MIKPLHVYAAGGALALLALVWLLKKGSAANLGANLGGAAVDVVVGLANGAKNAAVAAANNPEVNPLQPLGSWLGTTLYDVLHPVAAVP